MELSIFVDESGDFGEYDFHSPFYIISLVFHDQENDIFDEVEKLEQDLEVKDREIYDLKHELISNQIRMESDAKSLKDLEKENKELLLNKTRLEATLEDALLGKVDKLEKPGKADKPEEKKADHTEEKKEEKPSGKKA